MKKWGILKVQIFMNSKVITVYIYNSERIKRYWKNIIQITQH